jgi:predicted GIY-YIG superfamily endonuclease
MSAELSEESFAASFPFFFYIITCKNESLNVCYVGKTKDYKNRVSNHKTNSKYSEVKLYKFIRENGTFDNFNIKIVHKCICDEKSSIYIELALIKQYKEQGYQMLNIQIPNDYLKQDYNKMKCEQHYAIKQVCKCGWNGSKMNYSKHVKTSKKHRQFCIAEFENQLLNGLSPQNNTGTIVVNNYLNGVKYETIF